MRFWPLKRVTRPPRLALIVATVALVWVAAPVVVMPAHSATTCTQWNLANDFGAFNPMPDSCGNPNVWYYLTGTSTSSKLPTFTTSFGAGPAIPNVLVWDVTPNAPPFVGTNHTGNVLNLPDPTGGTGHTTAWPANTIAAYPTLNGGPVVVAWQSPIQGVIDVSGRVIKLDSACSGGGGLTYTLSLNGGSLTSGNVANTPLAEGDIAQSGMSVNVGDVIYLSVTGVSPIECDLTGLDLTITMQSAGTPGVPTDTAVAAPISSTTPTLTATATITTTPTDTPLPSPSTTPSPSVTPTSLPAGQPTSIAVTSVPAPTPPVSQTTPTPTTMAPGALGAVPTATVGVVSPVQVHNTPRTVVGGRATACDLQSELLNLTPGCEIISSISAPYAIVVYTLTYPGPSTPVGPEFTTPTNEDVFTDTADYRGHSLHIFDVAYLPPMGLPPGMAPTVVRVAVRAMLQSGAALQPGSTRFSVIAPPVTVPSAATPLSTPLPTYTAQTPYPTYTPLPTYTPQAAYPTYTPIPTYTPQALLYPTPLPPPTYIPPTPYPTYTPLPTALPPPTDTPQTPYPTYTPLPTYTPYPTYTPLPTVTPQITTTVQAAYPTSTPQVTTTVQTANLTPTPQPTATTPISATILPG